MRQNVPDRLSGWSNPLLPVVSAAASSWVGARQVSNSAHMNGAWRSRAKAWLLRWGPELTLFMLAVALRVSMRFSYHLMWGYDADNHWRVVQYIVNNGHLPAPDELFSAFHPPLYYAASALLTKLGVGETNMLWLPVGCGVIRLACVWAALERYVPSRLARVGGLALAAVLPVSVHVDGMPYPEPMSGMFAAAALLFIPRTFDRGGKRRWAGALVIGLLLGLQLLTKISALLCIAVVGVGAGCELLLSPQRPLRERIARALPWSLVVIVPLLVSGWYFGENVRAYGQPFVTSFDLKTQSAAVVDTNKIPYLDRRTLGYVVGWDNAIFERPYYPNTLHGHARFWPVLVTSSFVDYYNYSFSRIPMSEHTSDSANRRPLTEPLLRASKLSAVGGAVVSAITGCAWLVCLVRVFRRRQWGFVAALLLPAFAIAAALHFSIEYPLDDLGVTKSAYVQFGMAPLYAVFGMALAWSARARRRWPVLVLLVSGLYLVATYTLYCRFRWQLLPL